MEAAIILSILSISICVLIGSLLNFQEENNSVLVVSDSTAESEADEETDYQAGFRQGYNAFKEQMDSPNIPSLPKTIKYLRDEGSDEGSIDQEQKAKGYVDGYHRAADSMHCPRQNYSH